MSNKVKILWFIFVGWWLGLLWFGAGALACLTIIGIPIGMPMIQRTPEIMFMN
ncbi:YccF domain-containing protein [Halomicrobium sp. HM KBTZ05]|uniref:YccF domain-containing protein n=1 Tax=Halomicrobium sp. HM KBTZ05 TaxID=3242663 RepID=UPI0035562DA3